MTAIIRALPMNEHLELEISKHPERSFFTTLMNSQPQFSVESLIEIVQKETEYWVGILSHPENGQTFLQALDGIRHVFDALKHEDSALKDVVKGIAAQNRRDWAEAATCYCRALMDMHFADSDWSFAIGDLADDTPFDQHYPTKAERLKHNIEDPPRSSYADMARLAPHLYRIYANLDRTMCVRQELVQRQITCLANYMQEAEAEQAQERNQDSDPEK